MADAKPKHEGQVQPTPTQEENDLAALGLTPTEKAHDGSPDDPNRPPTLSENDPAHPEYHKRKESKPAPPSGGQGYQTRQVRPAPTPPQTPSHPPPLATHTPSNE